MRKIVALVPAAGVGARFGATIPKQYCELLGKSVLFHTLSLLQKSHAITHIALVISKDDAIFQTDDYPFEKVHVLRVGGETRALTVKNGLAALRDQAFILDDDLILVHDAARCCLSLETLNCFIESAKQLEQGALLALPVADTLKRANVDQGVAETVDRAGLWQAQTPQMFPAALLEKALNQPDLSKITDEASAMETLGYAPALIEGEMANFKLTFAPDYELAEAILRSRSEQNERI